MTPKEKAKELVEKYYQYGFPIEIDRTIYFEVDYQNAKQCALICCNEVLGYMGADRGTEFWLKVKQEIEKL